MTAVGGVRPETIASFLDAGVVGFGVGGELVRKDLFARAIWPELLPAHVNSLLPSRRGGAREGMSYFIIIDAGRRICVYRC